MCQWLNTAKNFLAFMGEPPQGMSIDRINNDGNYSCGECVECIANGWPMNVRWATPKQQALNTRRNILITYKGRTQAASQWAEELGLKPSLITSRYHKGWTPEKILSSEMFPDGRGFAFRKPIAQKGDESVLPLGQASLF